MECAHTATARPTTALLGRAHVVAAKFDPDSRYVAAGSEGGNVAVWDIRTGRRIAILGPVPAIITDINFSDDSRQLVVAAAADGTVRIWDWAQNLVAPGIFDALARRI